MRVAFFNSSAVVVNVAKFKDSFTGDFANFYIEAVTSHKVLSEGEIAAIGESGTTNLTNPYSKWVWNEEYQRYEAPISRPTEPLAPNEEYVWNDDLGAWAVFEDTNP